ncbi:MAG: DUF4330 domain-containing protein [Tissierellia bacterium]|nr:DUF4330 domain-containing protein [Tissierellia bacterium]
MILDGKGRLFGKINVIDLLFLILLAVAIVGGASRLKDSSISAETTTAGRVTLMVENVRQPTVDYIQEGQDLYFYDKGIHFGNIESKKVVAYTKETDVNGTWVKATVPDRFIVYINLDVDVSATDRAFRVGGEEIRVGGEYRVKSQTSTFSGIVVGMDIEGM